MLLARRDSNQVTRQYNSHVETDFKISQKLTSTSSTRPSSSHSKTHLNSRAKAGIITACIIVFIMLCFLLLELTYFGRQRRLARARRQANAGGDVELGGEMSNKENAVLESRVEIVVEGEAGEAGEAGAAGAAKGVREAKDTREMRETREAREEREQEEEDDDDDSDGDEWGGGRNTRTGMSLSRREG